MKFEDVFSQTYFEYKTHLKVFAKSIGYAFILPLMIASLLFALILGFTPLYSHIQAFSAISELADPTLAQTFSFIKTVFIYSFPSVILAFLAYVLLFLIGAGITKVTVQKKKFSPKDLWNEGKVTFWKYTLVWCYILLPILAEMLLILVSIALLASAFSPVFSPILFIAGSVFLIASIVGMFYMVYLEISWMLAPYIALNEKKSARIALQESALRVKGKWWTLLGYTLLFILILTAVDLVLEIAKSIITALIIYATGGNFFELLKSEAFLPSRSFLISTQILQAIITSIGQLIAIPLSILFFKNLYILTTKEGLKRPSKS